MTNYSLLTLFIEMISITKCKKILNKKGISYTDEEIIMIRNVLYKLEEVVHGLQKSHLSNNLNSPVKNLDRSVEQ